MGRDRDIAATRGGRASRRADALSEHNHGSTMTSPDEVKEPTLKFAIALTSVTLVGDEGIAVATELSGTVRC